MNKDKDTLALEEISEGIFTNQAQSATPITQPITFTAKVRIVKTLKGWDAQVLDEETKQFLQASDYLAKLVINQQERGVSDFKSANKQIKTSQERRSSINPNIKFGDI